MGALLSPSLVSTAIRHLPAPLLRLLDDWSHRRAQQRAAQRRERWQRAQAAPVAAPAPTE